MVRRGDGCISLYPKAVACGSAHLVCGTSSTAQDGSPRMTRDQKIRGRANLLEIKRVAQFVRHDHIYAQFLRQHIENEDNRLYVDADRALTAEDQRELLKSFDLIESQEMNAGKRAKYLRLADELAQHLQGTAPGDAVVSG